jgi:hypothetical protein
MLLSGNSLSELLLFALVMILQQQQPRIAVKGVPGP